MRGQRHHVGPKLTARAIVNPAAAGGRVGRQWPAIADALAAAIGPCQVRLTAGPLDAARLAVEAALDGCELIVAVGGDGTVNEVVDGLLSAPGDASTRPVLGIVMMGTGGDLARALALPPTVGEQARRLAGRDVRAIDVGRAHFVADDGTRRSRYFVNIASFGLSGLTARAVNARRWTRLLGAKLAFQLGVVQALLRWRNQPVALTVDGARELTATMKLCAIANGNWFGGGMRIAPDAAVDDGRLDIVIVGDVSAATLIRRLPMVYRGDHVRLPVVQVAHGRSIEARPLTPAPLPLELDGESPGHLPARFELVDRALRIRA